MNNLKCLVQIFHKASPSPTHPSKNSQVISSQVESRKTKHTNTSQTCWVAPYSAKDMQGPMMHRALVEQDLTPTPPALLVGDASHLLLEPVALCPASTILCVGAAQAQPCHAEARVSKAGKMTQTDFTQLPFFIEKCRPILRGIPCFVPGKRQLSGSNNHCHPICIEQIEMWTHDKAPELFPHDFTYLKDAKNQLLQISLSEATWEAYRKPRGQLLHTRPVF